MIRNLFFIFLTSITSTVLAPTQSWAAQSRATPSLADRPDLHRFIQMMVTKHDFDQGKLVRLFDQVKLRKKIITAINRPAESKPWYAYRPIFVTNKRINAGVQFWNHYQDDLERAQQDYGVPPQIITAIIGVETFYGRHKGRYRVIDSLSTLAFNYPARSKFFRSELAQFLLLAREEHRDPLSFKGSYAGAMGMAQFISSSYRRYSVDFDGDQHRDLWSSTSDAIGSVANYLKVHGWTAGTAITSPAVTEGHRYQKILDLGIKPKITIGEMKQNGIHPSHPLGDNTQAALIALQTRQGTEFWAILNNFYVITRYNHSPLYAMAVYQLAKAIRKQRTQPTPPDFPL